MTLLSLFRRPWIIPLGGVLIALGVMFIVAFGTCRLPREGTIQGFFVSHPTQSGVWGIRTKQPFCPVSRIVQVGTPIPSIPQEGVPVEQPYEIADVISSGWNWSVVVRLISPQ